MMLVTILMSLVATGLAIQCDPSLTAKQCDKYTKASNSLSNLVNVADGILAESMIAISEDAAKIIKQLLPTSITEDVSGNTITLNGQTIVVSSLTLEQFQKFFKEILETLRKITSLEGLFDEDYDFSTITSIIRKVTSEALDDSLNAPVSYGIISTYQDLRARVLEVLSGMNVFARTLIIKALDRYHYHLDAFAGLMDAVMNRIPIMFIPSTWNTIREQIHGLIENFRSHVAPTMMDKAVTDAKTDTVAFFDEIAEQKLIVKRGIVDHFKQTWEKVKKAIENLGVDIRESTLKVVEEYKPKVLAALKNVQKVLIDGAQKIIIEVNGAIVKVLTDGKTATSQ